MEADVNFGLVRFGQSATKTLHVANECRIATNWRVVFEPSNSGSLVCYE